ncbi:neuraminidase-like domain-containing protein [Sinorhizobium meliloti]|uniref:Tc toxin subunit A-related protein n=1 Tax=Rhizobium meliloti TaxID=382 RepID=UPI00398CBF44
MTLKILREGGFASAAADLQALLDWVQLPLSDLKTWSDATTALQAQALFIDPPGELDTDKARLCHVDGSPLSADDWLKLHRFVRLSRRSGIAFHDLDLALGAVASAGAPEAQLCALADLAALKDTLGLDWSGTAVLFAEMDAQGPDSLYDRLFIRTGLARLDKIFMRASDGTVLAAAPNLAGHEKTVAAAFGWKTADIASLAQRLGITKLTLATLARLYREAALARALGLQPAEYLALTASGSPFGDPPTLAPLAAFVDTIRASGDAGKRAARAYFTTGKADNDAAGKDFAGMLKTIRAAVLAYATPPGSDPVMVDAQRRTIVKTTLAQAFKLPPAVVSKLTDTPALIHGRQDGSALSPFQRPEDDASNAAAIAVLQQIDRVGTLLSTFTLTEIDLARLGSGLGILPANLTALLTAPDQAALQKIWDRTSHYAQWRDRFPLRGALLDPAITAVAAPDSATWTDPVVAAVAALAQVQPADVLTIVTAMINVTPAVQLHTDPLATLIAIDDRLAIAKAAATAADQLAALANDLEEDDTGDAALESLMAGVRERHDPDAWLTVSQQLNDPIREKRRDALVAYLLESKGLANKDALFSEFLIDPQINAFLVTSRIANAHAVSQIFVQRIRLGLELLNPDPRLRISPAQVGPEWDTLGDFRFWQANMEVLAFTHWYLDPALRDDITPAFKDLMAFTRENEPTPNNITQALTTYVERLGEVANLEICGTFLQEDFTPDEAFKYKNVLHVIGRTRGGVQRNYYYRRLNTYAASSEWTAWEPMKLDIQAVERDRPGGRTPGKSAKPVGGVHLIPVVWKRRLHVFWPSLVRKVETPNESPAIDVKTGQSNSSPPPEYWEIKLNWSRYDNGAWLPRQVSADFHETYKTTGFAVDTGGFGSVIGAPLFFETAEFPPPQNLFLKANLSNPHELAIDLFEQASGKDALRLSTFAFDDLRASVNVRYASGNASGDHVDFVGTSRRFMGLAGQGGLAAVTTSDKPEGFTVLRRGPPRTLTPLNQYYGKPLAAPFFLTDSQRSYHVDVVPATATVQKAVSKPDQTGVGTYDPFNTDIIAKAKAIATAISTEAPSNTPWVKFQREKVQASIGPTFQSLPALDVNLVTAAAIVPETTLSASVAQPLKDFYDVIDHNYFGVGMRSVEVPSIKATFTPFFHPFADQFAMTIRKFGSEALFRESTQRLSMAGSQPFKERYDPDPQQVTNAAMVESVDFGAGTPFGVYNNELFRDFHLFVADLLLQGNHFEEAIKALGRILDPLSPVEDPQLAWKFLPFREPGQLPFDQLVQKLAATSDDPDRKALLAQIEQSRLYPYQPYRIARLRPDAMKKLVFIKTVQAWLKWGEYFHRRYDPTSLAKAFQLYLVPSAMMGRKPELMSQRTVVPAKSYAELRPRLNELGDVMLTIEEQLPALTAVTGPSTGTTTGGALMRTAATGYFCMPPDSKFLELFDLVADRLYKLRNGMTLEGVRRQPALFGPKIDPAVLVKAAASGADLQAAVDGALGTDRPHHRFHVHLRIARERVEALANIIAALLTTLEKKEAEHLQLMHATHEREMQDFIAVVKQQQINEAEQNIVALDAQRAIAAVRWENMREQLGALDEVASPELDADTGAVKANGRYAPKRLLKLVDGANLNIAIAPGDPLNAINITPISVKLQNGKILAEEQDEVVRSFEAAAVNAAESVVEGLAGVISVLPNFEGAVKPLGAGAAVHFGGVQLGAVLTAGARAMRAGATMLGFLASNAGKQASFIWRERDFAERLNTAAAEILHIDQLKRGATLHKQQMVQDRDNHIEQTTRIKAVENFLASKFTAEQLYTRIETRLVDLQKRAWSMVLDAVEQAQACYRYDWQTDPPDLPSNLWDASLRGFYSADPMRLALSQLEASYLEQARRGPELTRHFSLKDINPWALVKLRETGSCDFALDEALFDLDNPGHYFRRIHSVAISIAGVTGPYTPVNATLRQNSNAVRIKVETTPTSTSYPRTGDGDERFKTISLPFEQMMVCSTGREDTGMFDTSFTDDRYRPFEGTGAISDWTLSLPRDFPLFDYRTISNVVIHIRYTARDGGAMLTSAATGALRKAFNEIRHEAAKTGIYRLISLRHDRQDDWHRFRGATAPTTLQVEREVLPHQFRDIAKRAETGSAMLIVKRDSEANVANATSVELDSDANEAWTVTIPPPSDDAIEDIYLLLKFTLPDA